MSEHDPRDPDSEPQPWPSSGVSLSVLLAVLLSIALIGGALLSGSFASASSLWEGHGHHRWRHHGASDPQVTQERVQHAASWLVRYVDANDEQADQLDAIIARSVEEVLALRDSHGSHRDALISLLQEPVIDRAALEEIRRAELELAESASRSLVQALADAAEVLTPEQRMELVELGQRFHD